MGTQENRLNETVLLSTQNKCYNGPIRKYSQFFFFSIYAGDNALNGCFLEKLVRDEGADAPEFGAYKCNEGADAPKHSMHANT